MPFEALSTGIITHVVVGLASGALGTGGTYAVLRERIHNQQGMSQERHSDTIKRLDIHDHEIADIKAHKHCGPCRDLSESQRQHDRERFEEQRRHDQVRFESLQSSVVELRREMTTTRESIEGCFEELVKELRKA